MSKTTPIRRTPELAPMPKDEFVDSCIVDHIDGVVAESILEKAQNDGCDSMWDLQR